MHTLSSAAKAVGIAKSTIYRAVKTGRLPAYMLKGGTYAIYPGDLCRVFPSIFEPQNEQREDFRLPHLGRKLIHSARGAAPRPTRAVTPFPERKVASTRDFARARV